MERINGNDLLNLGYDENKMLGIALQINKKRTGYTRQEMLDHYKAVLENPEVYKEDKVFKTLAVALLNKEELLAKTIPLRETAETYRVYGAEQIEQGAIDQMNTAMLLPVTVAGALMPDAHQGYGLPIGGVLATNNAVIPYGVGVDIGCRMALSVFDLPSALIETKLDWLTDIIIDHTAFGAGNGFRGKEKSDHSVLENPLFAEHAFIKNLKDKAWTQLGSSGGGNHFVEFGMMQFAEDDEVLGIKKGEYLALLTHSGSRGLGATIADHYTRLAKQICELPYKAQNLAYLDLNSEAGQEYWLAMNLAGDYASANHEIIHAKITKALGAEVLAKVENHHNFAWKEVLNGEEVIVHRKGATPAGKGVMGIIPGSMATPGFLVRGRGEPEAIHSASHGAGRLMSRTQAIKTYTRGTLNKILKEEGITLIGSGMDEVPMAYKDIHTVMAEQKDLVDVVATFHPKIVRMADDGSKED
ncbi:RtcB family protein [Gynurincola endophyticus]|uniref:RtcB family protein n=1 Tax=Gynurincola endophyticus TaxID=2479004 RepID=UPI000F8F6545|nr:RtcB family protein [Gynurincola endophyticus]